MTSPTLARAWGWDDRPVGPAIPIDPPTTYRFIPDPPGKVPFGCPVCGGTGEKHKGFYKTPSGAAWTDNFYEPCRSCLGTGLVWG